jgi:hypothetical protein
MLFQNLKSHFNLCAISLGISYPKKDDINALKPKADLSRHSKGIYTLKKEPIGVYSPENENIGITNDSRVVGIDPGIRSLVTGATHRTSETPGMSFSISNAEYKYVCII